jgi:hypothetical protein
MSICTRVSPVTPLNVSRLNLVSTAYTKGCASNLILTRIDAV